MGVTWELGVGIWELTGTPRDLTGALLVDKPSGPTSHDIVAFARRVLQTRRIGHTGTLDPLATGLLVLLVGPATRLLRFLESDEKEYIADVRLGVATPTYDAQSLADGVRYPPADSRSAIADTRWPMKEELDRVLDRFRGSFLQTPPPYSAKKIAGVAAYEKARRNEAVDLRPVPVSVRELEVLPSDLGPRTSDTGHGGLVRLRVAASAGFYVRSLAHDLGQAIGCGAHLEALRRIRAGRFRVEEAATLDTLSAGGVVPVNALLAHFPSVTLTEEGVRRAAHGNPLAAGHQQGGCQGTGPFYRVLDGDGGTLAVAERRPDGLLHPLVVLR